jgi:hypothetical protein
MSQVFFRRLPVLLVALLLSMAAQAWELSGSKRIRALTRDQQHIDIGHVDFQPLPDGRSAFTLHMDSSRWVDHFLSMK